MEGGAAERIMLRITHSKNAAGAAKYFDEGLQRADYYHAEEPSIGQWGGKAAERLGLVGEVQKDDFVALCHNQKPDGSKLNPRNSDRRKVGYDFTFSAPKSVSVAYAVGGDDRIKQAFETSVEETMAELEQDMRTQNGQGKAKQLTQTGEMAWASFTHRTSRPVDGVPDPHLHRHAFAFNTTWNEKKGRFQAGEFSTIKQDAPYYEAAFDARLAARMKQLGYGIERRGLSWEIRSIEDPTLAKFSRRTAQIEQRAAAESGEPGGLTAKQKEKLGALTRAKKLVGRSWQQLKQVWRSWLSDSEKRGLAPTKTADEKKKTVAAPEAVLRAEEHLFERKSVVTATQLKTEALKRGYGDVLPEQLDGAITHSGRFYSRTLQGRDYLTTRAAIAEETRMLQHVQAGRGTQAPLNPHYTPQAEYLNDEQKAAIRHALNDTNNVTIISGGAGTGKTTLMKEVRDGVEAGGTRFIGFAPSAAASRGVMRQEGFDKADTVAALLHSPKLQEQTKGSVIWVDEAGLVGNKDMNRIFEIARQQRARVLLTGDTRQHRSVAAGDALRILEQEAGVTVARVSTIQRQRDSVHYKQAVSLAAEGKGDAALLKLDRMGAVTEIADRDQRLEQLVAEAAQAERAGKTTLIVSPTHAEGHRVTAALRQRLQQNRKLRGEERQVPQLQTTHWTEEQKRDLYGYREAGLTVEFHQNANGHVKGERWQVTAGPSGTAKLSATGPAGKRTEVALSEAKRFTVYRQSELALAKGDRIRITKGGKTREGTRINNGDLFTVTGFTKAGHLKLHTGKTLDKGFGHVAYGYVTTSHAAQGRTVDRVYLAQSSRSAPAASREQFYVSISRGREQCRIYTDDKRALERVVMRDTARMSARELAAIDRRQSRRKLRAQEQQHASKTGKNKEHGRETAL